ncbi:MAG: M67 family metallopeptidase [Candidatus Thorarchaeota archaeon]
MEYRLRLGTGHLERLYHHAETCLPLESVALLFGSVEEDTIVVNRVELTENMAESRTTFSIDPVLQYNLFVKAEELGEDLVCIFHSHPAPPAPSKTDLKNMVLNSVVWLIASKQTGTWESRAFILDDGQPVEIIVTFSEEET